MEAPPESRKRQSRPLGRPLQSPAFRRLFASSVTSTLGAAISLVSVNWIVYHYTHNTLDITYLGLTGIAPGIALGLFAGVIADRYNRRSLMVTADLARMLGMGLLTGALFLAGFSLPLILATMILVNCFSSIFTPASQAIVPRLVAKASLEDANGLLQSTTGVVSTAGSAAGGILVVAFGAAWGLGINSLTYALSAMFLIQIAGLLGRPEGGPSRKSTTFRKDFSEGMGYVLNHRSIFAASFGYFPSNFLSACVGPYFVVYAGVRFGGNAAVYGYLVAAVAAGVAVGALLVGRVAARPIAGILMGACLVIEGACFVVLALSSSLGFSILAAAGDGLMIGFANTLYYSTIQAMVPSEVLGRVLSVGDFGSFAAIPAGLVVTGAPTATSAPTVTIGGVTVPVMNTAVLTPGSAGEYQIAIQLPASMPAGAVSIQASVGGVTSPAGVQIFIGGQ